MKVINVICAASLMLLVSSNIYAVVKTSSGQKVIIEKPDNDLVGEKKENKVNSVPKSAIKLRSQTNHILQNSQFAAKQNNSMPANKNQKKLNSKQQKFKNPKHNGYFFEW